MGFLNLGTNKEIAINAKNHWKYEIQLYQYLKTGKRKIWHFCKIKNEHR